MTVLSALFAAPPSTSVSVRVWPRLVQLGRPLRASWKQIDPTLTPNRIRGKCGRGTGSRAIIFGLLKRGNCIYTEIFPNASEATPQAIICGMVGPTALSKPTAGEVMTAWWILELIDISGSIIEAMNLSGAQSMSMGFSPSGAMQSIA